MNSILLFLFLIFPLTISSGSLVKNINECPKLNPRKKLPTSVHDLRPDDIKLMLALGDSVTAAFVADVDCSSTSWFTENRGVSYAMGGDDGAFSLANFMKHYSSKLRGASLGNHSPQICNGKCAPYKFPKQDNLNVAITGALSKNLEFEVKYLLSQYKKEPEEFKNSFKFLTIFIGGNDLCSVCFSGSNATDDQFERRLKNVIEEIRSNVSNVIVNILNEITVSRIFDLAKGQKYCSKPLIPMRIECPCAFSGEHARQLMDKYAQKYNQAIKRVVQYYSKQPSDTFAVIDYNIEFNMTTFPIESLSCVDCFHPSILLHKFLAKTLWNSLLHNLSPNSTIVNWENDKRIRCWEEKDRIRTR